MIIPALLVLFRLVKNHYVKVERQIERSADPELPVNTAPPAVVLQVQSWDNLTEKALRERPGMIAVILPDLVEARWWEYLLHMQRANVLRSLLLLKGNQQVAVISMPWYLERRRKRASEEPAEARRRTCSRTIAARSE